MCQFGKHSPNIDREFKYLTQISQYNNIYRYHTYIYLFVCTTVNYGEEKKYKKLK